MPLRKNTRMSGSNMASVKRQTSTNGTSVTSSAYAKGKLMATPTEQTAASKQREMIPREWLLEFQTWSDSALLSLHESEGVDSLVRSYAIWELEYRIAFDKKPLPVKELPKADRSPKKLSDPSPQI